MRGSLASTECGAPGRVPLKNSSIERRLRWIQAAASLKLNLEPVARSVHGPPVPAVFDSSIRNIRMRPKALCRTLIYQAPSEAISTRDPPPIVDETASLRSSHPFAAVARALFRSSHRE